MAIESIFAIVLLVLAVLLFGTVSPGKEQAEGNYRVRGWIQGLLRSLPERPRTGRSLAFL